MPKRNWILVVSAIGIAVATIILVGFAVSISVLKEYSPADLAETRDAVGQSMTEILPAAVESSADPALREAAGRLAGEPYVAWVWIADAEGKIVVAQGGPAREGDTIAGLDTNESDIIDSVEPGLLSEQVEIELRLAVAIRREGEHNDVLRHAVRSIPGPEGKAAAYAAIAYDASPGISAPPSVSDQVMVVLFFAGFAAYWFGLPLWVLLDARARRERAALWGLFVLFANLVGLLAYLVVARQKAA